MARKRTTKTSKKTAAAVADLPADAITNPPMEAISTTNLEPTPIHSHEETLPAADVATAQEDKPREFVQNFGIAGDYQAGVRLIENRQEHLMSIKFDEKPGTDVLDCLKQGGFRWNSRDEIWNRYIRPDSAMQIRIEAERTYQAACELVRQERGMGDVGKVPF